jgi:hypothetical protein
MKTVFLRTLKADDKAAALRAIIRDTSTARQRFQIEPTSFGAIPRSPFAYWASSGVLQCFAQLPPFQANGRSACIGLSTEDDARFLRLTWEPIPSPKRYWYPFAKGGAFSRYYYDHHLLLNWGRDGYELKRFAERRTEELFGSPSWSRWINNWKFYYRPGLTWPRRTQGGLSLRALSAGCIFANKGPTAFVQSDDDELLLALLALTNSEAFRALVDLQMAFGSYEAGVIQRTPVPKLTQTDESALASLARRAWSSKRSLDTRTETSHAFTLPALLQVDGDTLTACATAWAERVSVVEADLVAIQAEIDERCFELYGIGEDDRRAITEGFGGGAPESGEAEETAAADVELEDEGEVESSADPDGLAAELVSWAVGVAFGRFDVRLATGERTLPSEPEPFDPLPVCSLGMLTGEDGLPLTTAPSDYPLAFPDNGILVDDPGDPRDLTSAVRAVFETVFGSSADELWQEAATLLDSKGHDPRAWLGSSFFEHHLKLHSKSRRKAPILWQLGTPSGRYSVWLYAHRLTADSFFQLQNDVVAPKLAYEERRLTNLAQSAGGSPSAKERTEISVQDAYVEELRVLLDEVKRVAPLWKPTLDDGIVLVMAPLWRLVRHKAWQRELKAKWAELAAGKYDWAHLAMRLWPERVVPKCAIDRSLAIAHGLEEVFWVEDEGGKWQSLKTPAAPVEELVNERSSTAVKEALQSLLDMPTDKTTRRTAAV